MAYDPNNGSVYEGGGSKITEGHYSLRADDFDGPAATKEDPVVAARRDALRAATELNELPIEQRAHSAQKRVKALTEAAKDLAFRANIDLTLN